jgi:hypothetical protein
MSGRTVNKGDFDQSMTGKDLTPDLMKGGIRDRYGFWQHLSLPWTLTHS